MNALIHVARNAGPYVAIEVLLPGGSVIALLLWLFRQRFKNGAGPLDTPGVGRCAASGALGTPGSGVAVLP